MQFKIYHAVAHYLSCSGVVASRAWGPNHATEDLGKKNTQIRGKTRLLRTVS